MQELSGQPASRAKSLNPLIAALTPPTNDPANSEFLRALSLLGGALFALALLAYFGTTTWSLPFPRDKITLVLGRDFLNLWMFGRLAFEPEPARFYDLVTYNQELARLLGPAYLGQNLPNPPTAFVVMAPFGLLSYLPALACWAALSGVAFYLAGRREVSDLRTLALVAVSPAALMCVISGQSSFLTTAALLTIFAWIDKRPVAAGVLIGLLTVKPQLGVLFPFALAASGRWRVFVSAAITALLLFGASLSIGGPESWYAYVTKALPLQREVLGDPAGKAVPFQPTIFMNLRALLGNSVSEKIQLAFAIAAIAAVTAAFHYRKDSDSRLLQTLFFACTACTSPYMGDYDLLPLTFASVALIAEEKLDAKGRRLAQFAFWVPALQLLFGNVQIPGPAFVAPVFAAYLLQNLFAPEDRAEAAVATPRTSTG